MAGVMETVTKKVGPLPLWGYAVVAGGLYLILFKKPKAATPVDTSQPVGGGSFNPNDYIGALPPSGGETNQGSGTGPPTGTPQQPPDVNQIPGGNLLGIVRQEQAALPGIAAWMAQFSPEFQQKLRDYTAGKPLDVNTMRNLPMVLAYQRQQARTGGNSLYTPPGMVPTWVSSNLQARPDIFGFSGSTQGVPPLPDNPGTRPLPGLEIKQMVYDVMAQDPSLSFDAAAKKVSDFFAAGGAQFAPKAA